MTRSRVQHAYAVHAVYATLRRKAATAARDGQSFELGPGGVRIGSGASAPSSMQPTRKIIEGVEIAGAKPI